MCCADAWTRRCAPFLAVLQQVLHGRPEPGHQPRLRGGHKPHLDARRQLRHPKGGLQSRFTSRPSRVRITQLSCTACRAAFTQPPRGVRADRCARQVGLHWSENTIAPFPIGDSTLSAEAARLIFTAMARSLPLCPFPAAGCAPIVTLSPRLRRTKVRRTPVAVLPQGGR